MSYNHPEDTSHYVAAGEGGGPAMAPETMVHGSLFRSEPMSLVQLYIPTEIAHLVVAELARVGKVHFKDVRVAELCRL